MALRATCPGCHKALSFPEASAGQKTRCPVCQTRFLITPDAAAASPAALPPPPAASPAAPSGQPAPRPKKKGKGRGRRSSWRLLTAAAGAVVLALIGGAVAGYYLLRSPRDTRATGEKLYDRLVKGTVIVFTPDGQGSGVLVHRGRKLVLTNYHVVGSHGKIGASFPLTDKNGQVLVDREEYIRRWKGGEVIRAKTLRVAKGKDLALLELEKVPGTARAVKLATRSPRPGQTVHSCGSPGASEAAFLYTQGVVRQVSQKNWTIGGHAYDARVVEAQSPTNSGDSGGPLVDDRCELVGVTHGYAVFARQLSVFIDVSEVKRFLEEYGVPSEEVMGSGGTLDDKGGGPSEEDTPAELVKLLTSRDPAARAQAARKLGELGEEARSAYGDLLQALKDDTPAVRREARAALEKLGKPSRADVPALTAALADQATDVRACAAELLARAGEEAQPAAGRLTAALADPEAPVRRGAAVALGNVGRANQYGALVAALADPDETVRTEVRAALAKLDPPARDDAPALAAALGARDAGVRLYAAMALGKMGEDARPAEGALTAALRDLDSRVRLAAGGALAGLGRRTQFPALLEALKDPGEAVRRDARALLDKLGPPGAEEVELLAPAAQDPRGPVRHYALETLARLGAAARPAVPAMRRGLEDPEAAVRASAARALAAVGKPAAQDAYREIVPLLLDEDDAVRAAAETALVALGPPDAAQWPRLQALLAAPDTPPEVVRFLAGTLADAGANAGAAVPGILKRLAASTDRRRRLLLAQAVDKIRPITGETVAQLARLAGTFGDDVEFRVQVVRTLGAAPAAAGPVGPLFTLMAAPDAEVAALAGQVLRDRAAAFAREDVPALAAAVHSPSQAAALLALQGLGTLGPDAASAVSDVRRAAGNSRAPVRLAAVTTLGKIGPAAKEAVADLLMHLKDENKELQLQAAVALVAIDPTAAKAAAPVLVRDRDRPEARAALIKAGRPAAERLAGALEFELRGATNAEARVQVINLLVEMGAAARYNQLLVLLSNLERSDPSSNVRSAARDARAKLQAARD